jgi:hypothetical protein
MTPTAFAAGFLLLTAVLGAIGAWVRWIRPRWRKARAKWTMAVDSIVGREEVRDSITDEVKIPALPGIGVRMAAVERHGEMLAVAVQKLVDQQVHQEKLERRVDRIEADVEELKSARVERVVSKAESIAAWKAIEATAKATPDAEGEVIDDQPNEGA